MGSADDITDPAANVNKKRSSSEDVEENPALHASGPANTGPATSSTPSKPSKKRPKETKNVYCLSRHPLYRLMKKLSEDAYAKSGDQFEFHYNDLVQILIKIKSALSKEPPLVRIAPPVVIVGDIHGQFNDLNRMLDTFGDREMDVPGVLRKNFVFLGDYVDRGKQSLEVIVYVFIMKILFPTQVFLLRGNHECKPINRVYGFMQEMQERFDKNEGNNLFHMFNEAFTHMPLACLVSGVILCMHGGISPRLTSLDEINKIPKPLVDPNSNELACDLLWSDPMIGLKGFKPNAIRGVSVHFGEDVLHSTMAELGVKLIVRGHQMMMNGFNFFGNQRLVTVFTAASYYPDRANRGAVLHVDESGCMGFHLLSPHSGGGEKVFRGDVEDSNKYDTGYTLSVADEKVKMIGGGGRYI
ncbi:hypothetical protein PRIPAC_94344 [Pristionchus pacificus]|uniref:Serine/threonine-protein phosphatase n=1 Tax=Pristionchus pacificus TaxID=54126 RepID=A0A2A6CE46_PRIPA|nr:hypothetical protein PRIPAC_94344 [Pristionchus pacificus]|eukprot:PDM76370.1 Calcineurin-like phosphoesterase [Pristionchus pacificus]